MYTQLPPPLTLNQNYILLCLIRGATHGYGIQACSYNDSHGSVDIPSGTLYPLLKKMVANGLIEEAGPAFTESRAVEQMHYDITEEGILRLKEELTRMNHAVEIGRANGLFSDDGLPPDLQRLLAATTRPDPS